jgi:ankyrin repeat protein
MRLNSKAIKWLIKEFCNVNAKDSRGETSLHIAVQQNDRDIISVLLESGADRHLENAKHETPLNLAKKISEDLLTFLREYKVCGYRARAEYAYSAENEAEISFRDGDRINNIKVTDEYGVGWWYGEANGKKGYFPSNYVKVSEQLRDESRPPLGAPEPEDGPNDTRDEYGQTPLHKAAFEDRCGDVFQILMDPKVNLNAQDRNGWTPMHCAASQQSLEVLLVLLQKKGLVLSKRSTDGTTALHYAARIKPQNPIEEQKINQILDKFRETVDIDILGKSGETALHHSVMKGNEYVTKYLLEHQANPNAVSDNNTTPLFFAVGLHDILAVKLLLKFGANPTIKSKRGTPIELAAQANSSTILQLLEGKLTSSKPDPT